jgi:hypothetical protein
MEEFETLSRAVEARKDPELVVYLILLKARLEGPCPLSDARTFSRPAS